MIYYFRHINDFDLFVHASNENEAWGRLEDYENHNSITEYDDEMSPATKDFDHKEWEIYELDGNEYAGEKM